MIEFEKSAQVRSLIPLFALQLKDIYQYTEVFQQENGMADAKGNSRVNVVEINDLKYICGLRSRQRQRPLLYMPEF